MINLPGSSSKNALFEDEMRGRRGMAGGEEGPCLRGDKQKKSRSLERDFL